MRVTTTFLVPQGGTRPCCSGPTKRLQGTQTHSFWSKDFYCPAPRGPRRHRHTPGGSHSQETGGSVSAEGLGQIASADLGKMRPKYWPNTCREGCAGHGPEGAYKWGGQGMLLGCRMDPAGECPGPAGRGSGVQRWRAGGRELRALRLPSRPSLRHFPRAAKNPGEMFTRSSL